MVHVGLVDDIGVAAVVALGLWWGGVVMGLAWISPLKFFSVRRANQQPPLFIARL